jgi:hypothetical protein
VRVKGVTQYMNLQQMCCIMTNIDEFDHLPENDGIQGTLFLMFSLLVSLLLPPFECVCVRGEIEC